METRRIPRGSEACVLAVAKGHAGATSIHVQLFADYSSESDALRDPKRVDDNEPLPFLGAALADVTLKLPSRRPSTAKEKTTRGQHSLAIQAQKALKNIKDDACATPRWVASDRAIFGEKIGDRRAGMSPSSRPTARWSPSRGLHADLQAAQDADDDESRARVKDVVFAGETA